MANHTEYLSLFKSVKIRILDAQVKTISAANSQMLLLYWQIGHMILENQSQKGWGAKVIDLLSKDLKKELPQLKGFSVRNLKYMRSFASYYPPEVLDVFNKVYIQLKDPQKAQRSVKQLIDKVVQQAEAQTQNTDSQGIAKVQQVVAQNTEKLFLESVVSRVSWSHHIILMDKEPHLGKRLWYMLHAIEHGISRNVLAIQIENGLFERQIMAKKINNFPKTLPPAQSDFANYLLKDPYIFDFVQVKEKADERSIEEQLASHITKFLLELGRGFAFMGRQVHFEIGNSDFYADLLFYHTKLKCYVVVELKARSFEPGDASQLNFYVNVVNDQLKTETDHDTIGLLLCKGKNEVVAEYSLKGYSNAIGISDYQISKAVPEELKSALPNIEDIEKEMKELE